MELLYLLKNNTKCFHSHFFTGQNQTGKSALTQTILKKKQFIYIADMLLNVQL